MIGRGWVPNHPRHSGPGTHSGPLAQLGVGPIGPILLGPLAQLGPGIHAIGPGTIWVHRPNWAQDPFGPIGPIGHRTQLGPGPFWAQLRPGPIGPIEPGSHIRTFRERPRALSAKYAYTNKQINKYRYRPLTVPNFNLGN